MDIGHLKVVLFKIQPCIMRYHMMCGFSAPVILFHVTNCSESGDSICPMSPEKTPFYECDHLCHMCIQNMMSYKGQQGPSDRVLSRTEFKLHIYVVYV